MSGHNQSADVLHDRRDDGVARYSQAVHLGGNPMSQSIHSGFAFKPLSRGKPALILCQARKSSNWLRWSPVSALDQHTPCEPIDALGVGHKDDPFTELRRSHAESWYDLPLRVIPHRGQVAEYVSDSPVKETCDVLQHDPSGSNVANESGHDGPEPPLVRLNSTVATSGDGLAGKSSGHNVGCGTVAPPFDCGSGVVMDRNLGPVSGQHALAVRVDLHETGSLDASALKSERHATDACEQLDGVHRSHPSHSGHVSRSEA